MATQTVYDKPALSEHELLKHEQHNLTACRLLMLPAELRLLIYAYLEVRNQYLIVNRYRRNRVKACTTTLRVCRALRADTLPSVYCNNVIQILHHSGEYVGVQAYDWINALRDDTLPAIHKINFSLIHECPCTVPTPFAHRRVTLHVRVSPGGMDEPGYVERSRCGVCGQQPAHLRTQALKTLNRIGLKLGSSKYKADLHALFACARLR